MTINRSKKVKYSSNFNQTGFIKFEENRHILVTLGYFCNLCNFFVTAETLDTIVFFLYSYKVTIIINILEGERYSNFILVK